MIIRPLTKIKVISSPLKCTPGSIGYVIEQNRYLGYNIWTRSVLISRIGKTGKDRLEVMTLRDVMVNYNDLKINNEGIKILKNLELPAQLLPCLHYRDVGSKRPRYSHYADYTQFEIMEYNHKDTLNMPVWEFISYITATSLLISAMCNPNIDIEKIKLTASRPLNANNRALFDLFPYETPPADLIGTFFIHGLRRDQKNKDKLYESKYREFFDVEINRIEYMTRLRAGIAMISYRIKEYHRNLYLLRRNQISALKDILGYYRRNTTEYRDEVERGRGMVYSGPLPKGEKIESTKTKMKRA